MSDKISGSELQEKYDTEASFSPLEDAKKIDVADEAAWNQLIEKTDQSVFDLYTFVQDEESGYRDVGEYNL